MKTVKAKVLSSTPIRISKAASILSKFVSTENGASQAVGAYLRRTSEAFNELAQLHKENKSSSRSHRKKHSDHETEAIVGQGQPETKQEKLSRDPIRDGEEIERKIHKKKSVEKAEFVHGNIDGESGQKKHKKRRKEKGDVGNSDENGFKNGNVEIGEKFETNDVEANERRKKKKKRKSVEVEEGGEYGSEEGGEYGSEEQSSKKKKKKRRKIGDEEH